MNSITRTRSHLAIVIAIASVSLGACNNDPAKGKTQATVASAAEAVAAPAAGAVNYAFSNDGSKVEFVGAKVTAKHEGSFATFHGTVSVVDSDATKSSVKADIDVASLTVEPAKLSAHLKTPDLLDAAKFPTATFASTTIKAGGGDATGATHTVTGNLTLHGVTKAITFPAKIKIEGDSVSVDAEFAINRKDFAIVYPGMPDDLIKDDVLIKLTLHAKKSA